MCETFLIIYNCISLSEKQKSKKKKRTFISNILILIDISIKRLMIQRRVLI